MYITRKNKILVGCLSLLLMISIGYALFSEQVTINGTATARGNFDYNITCYLGTPDIVSSSNYTSKGYENESCVVDKNNVTYNVDLSYPGAVAFFTQEITNTGSIPVNLYLDQIYEYNACIYNKSDDSLVKCQNVSTNSYYMEGMFYGYKTASGVAYNQDELEDSEYYDINNGTYKLETGNTIYLGIKLVWSEVWTDKTTYFKIVGTEQFTLEQITN